MSILSCWLLLSLVFPEIAIEIAIGIGARQGKIPTLGSVFSGTDFDLDPDFDLDGIAPSGGQALSCVPGSRPRSEPCRPRGRPGWRHIRARIHGQFRSTAAGLVVPSYRCLRRCSKESTDWREATGPVPVDAHR